MEESKIAAREDAVRATKLPVLDLSLLSSPTKTELLANFYRKAANHLNEEKRVTPKTIVAATTTKLR